MDESYNASEEYNRRAAITQALHAGKTIREIIDFFNYPQSTVYDVAKRYRATRDVDGSSGTPARKVHARARPVRTQNTVKRAQKFIEKNPRTPLTVLGSKVKVSRRTMGRIAAEDLRYKSYVLKVRQMLSEDARRKRVAKGNLLLSSLKHDASGRIRFFSDEKIFTVEEYLNRHNDRWLARDPDEVPVVPRVKFPANVHVLGVVSSEGDVMPPHFFKKGETVTKEVYLDVLKKKVRPWIVKVAAGRPYVFQQDGAPAHNSHLVQNWLDDNMDMYWPKEFWPPNSPDLNPLDYYVWGVVERDTNKSRHPNVDSLKKAIQARFKKLKGEELKRACQRFRPRLEAAIAADGGYIE